MRWKYILPAIFWAVCILIILCIPGDDIPDLSFFAMIPFFDKWVHGLLFAVLACFIIFGSRKQEHTFWFSSRSVFFTLACSIIYAGITELIQMFIGTGRQGDILDWFADATGSICGIAVYLLWNSIFVKSNKTKKVKNLF
jgi:VanZ family protein